MYEFKITEKHNLLSTREGYIIKTKNISAAKKITSRNRVFQGTVLTIESLNGDLIAYKNCGEKWQSVFWKNNFLTVCNFSCSIYSWLKSGGGKKYGIYESGKKK